MFIGRSFFDHPFGLAHYSKSNKTQKERGEKMARRKTKMGKLGERENISTIF